ncbi:unnamed protein product [Schistosoma curassoni]|uniref:Uncharacterized protein n=1 Tax=Schistosoma curassoni TaxID=6186 RepID=A0A183L0T4_9TREM|nr:unnamed protein product [Schistosoma curassoni]
MTGKKLMCYFHLNIVLQRLVNHTILDEQMSRKLELEQSLQMLHNQSR